MSVGGCASRRTPASTCRCSATRRPSRSSRADVRTPPLLVTSGEPAGIGPELCALAAAAMAPDARPLVLVGDHAMLSARARRVGVAAAWPAYDARAAAVPPVSVWHVPLVAPVTPGTPDPVNAEYVRTLLALASDACAIGAFSALVTAPVQKSTLLDAGIPFTGHTEFFAERTGTPRVVMMLTSGPEDDALRVALVTTHLALADVPRAITRVAVAETLAIVDAQLKRHFGIAAPRIAVCGLNPHAGEGGHLGREEIDVIAPVISEARAAGLDVSGPYPADTIFVPHHAQAHDAIVAMYHDQGLPVLKAASFGGGINVTLGLPYVRTSVDHGTALDLARDGAKIGGVDAGSLGAALALAARMSAPDA
ncbi:MAG: 4-hydroxythreonine-4-phosphate dehydrogenase PdxA [Proteobacteria bacterium]|nr:4-hydroxythreonine-4-phosphate dehydrogenase PdxA [Pseudomonadota bacterium]